MDSFTVREKDGNLRFNTELWTLQKYIGLWVLGWKRMCMKLGQITPYCFVFCLTCFKSYGLNVQGMRNASSSRRKKDDDMLHVIHRRSKFASSCSCAASSNIGIFQIARHYCDLHKQKPMANRILQHLKLSQMWKNEMKFRGLKSNQFQLWTTFEYTFLLSLTSKLNHVCIYGQDARSRASHWSHYYCSEGGDEVNNEPWAYAG